MVHGWQSDIYPFVPKYPHIVDLHAVMFGRVVFRLSEVGIGESCFDNASAHLLIHFVGVKNKPIIIPVLKVCTGSHSE